MVVRRATRFWTVSVAQRAEYGRVWDSVSQSVDDARKAVAGYSDDAEWVRSGKETANDVVAETGAAKNDVVLEIGCGAARVGAQLAPRVSKWIGCDVSAKMLAHAKQALASYPNVSLVHLDGNGLTGVGDNSIDIVYCTTVFMHLEEWDRYRYVREAFRVLKPGGCFYVDSFSLLSRDGWSLFEKLSALPPLARPPHISKGSTPQELEAYVSKAGFEQQRTRGGDLYVTVIARKPLQRASQ
jgi:SAM-dependent methyltransferase